MKAKLLQNIYNIFDPLSANPTKWLNTLKKFVDINRRIVWVCLNILWGLALKGFGIKNANPFLTNVPIL